MKWLTLLLLLSGCATTGLTDIVQKDVSKDALYDICEPYKHVSFKLYGCTRHAFGKCYIYVLNESEHPDHEEYLDTVEHERRHCLEGHFHKS